MPRPFSLDERSSVLARLQQAAADLVAQRGFRRTTVAELARAAGISKGSFYAFFESKEALFLQLLLETEAEIRTALTQAAGWEGSPREVLGRVLRFQLEALIHHPLLRVLADPQESAALFRGLPPEALEAARLDDDRWFGELFGGLARRGVVRPESVPVLAALPRLLFALVQGREWLADDFEAVSTELVEALADRLATPGGSASTQEEP